MIKNIWPDRFLLKGKISVVTGGTGLVGKGVVTGLAQAGSKVIIGDIDKENGLKLEEECKKNDLDVTWKKLDITNLSSIKTLINELIKIHNKIDVWVNLAYPRTKDWGNKFEDVEYNSLKKNVDMHMNGYLICCQQIAEQMKKQKQGSIINFGSIYGIVGPDFSIYKGTDMTMAAAYAAIKGGIINFTRYLATYYGEYGVRVNAVCPGSVADKQPLEFVKNYTMKTPLKRLGTTEEMACPVIFLASDAASYITGHILMVDGGWTAW